MDFFQAMDFVERQHYFPSDLKDCHQKRTEWLIEKSGLNEKLRSISKVIIAGSSGKGSTVRFLAYILREIMSNIGAKEPIGFGIKPPIKEDLEGNRERYQIFYPGEKKPQWVDKDDFANYVNEILPLVRKFNEKEYNFGQLAPYDLRYWLLSRFFIEKKVKIGIFEANIGLKNDPTSALKNPDLIAITPISTDHQKQLDLPLSVPDYLKKIGEIGGPIYHKVGGLKRNIPVVIGCQKPEVVPAIKRLIYEKNASPVWFYGEDFTILESTSNLNTNRAKILVDKSIFTIELSVLGKYQLQNATQAAAIVKLLYNQGIINCERTLLEESIIKGIKKTYIPARLQLLSKKPLIFLSKCSSPMEAKSTLESIKEIQLSLPQHSKVIIGVSIPTRDHDAQKIFEILTGYLEEDLKGIILTYGENQADLQSLKKWTNNIKRNLIVLIEEKPRNVYYKAKEICNDEHDIILLVGTYIATSIL